MGKCLNFEVFIYFNRLIRVFVPGNIFLVHLILVITILFGCMETFSFTNFAIRLTLFLLYVCYIRNILIIIENNIIFCIIIKYIITLIILLSSFTIYHIADFFDTILLPLSDYR